MENETIPSTLEAEHEALRAGLLEVHQPRSAHQQVLVDVFIDAVWDLKAARRVDREFWFQAGSHYAPGAAGIAEAQFKEKEGRFRIHLRHLAMAERSYYRALDALKALHRHQPRALPAAGETSQPQPPAAPRSEQPQLRYPVNISHSGRRSQVVRQRSAKPLFSGSNPLVASNPQPPDCAAAASSSVNLSVSLGANRSPETISSAAATQYSEAADAIATLNPTRSDHHPTSTGAMPPASHPIEFMTPVAVPRTSGRITSNRDAKMFASYNSLNKPQTTNPAISHPMLPVSAHNTANGASHSTPAACTRIRPPGHRRRSESAIQPPATDPIRLAVWIYKVAVSPAMAGFR